MNLQIIQKNGETILPICFYGQNRSIEGFKYHNKVFNFYQTPMNYIQWPFHLCGHGDAIQNLINQTLHLNIDYYFFCDSDAIPTRKDFIDVIYSKVCDKKTIFGPAWTSNHKSPNHIHAAACFLMFSRQLYLELGKPEMRDIIPRSDTVEEMSWLAAEKGYTISLVYPNSFYPLTKDEMQSSGCPEFWLLGNKFQYGLGTQYSDLLFHTWLAGIKRSSDIFIDKCKEIIGEYREKRSEAIVVCVDFFDYLSITLPKNKQLFDNFIVITSKKDVKTQQICKENNVTCIISDVFYKNGYKFNKGGAINEAIKYLKYKDWVTFLDADILLPEDFKEKTNVQTLDINKFYGSGRRFVWTYNDFLDIQSGKIQKKQLEYISGAGVGFFQMVNLRSKTAYHYGLSNLYNNSNNADQVDIDFLKKFCPKVEHDTNLVNTNLEILHLGPNGVFHNGRFNGNERIDVLKNKTFFEIPNVSSNPIYCDDKYSKIFYNTTNDRDYVFRDVLAQFNDKPIKILEIGTSRSFDGKAGDGWSTMFWVDYIRKHGGSLMVCDVSQESIDVAKEITKEISKGLDVQFITGDGVKYIDNSFDLIFLDGSDDPQQTFEQFEKINRYKSAVLLDDAHVKAVAVRNKYKDFYLYQVNNIHQMVRYDIIS